MTSNRYVVRRYIASFVALLIVFIDWLYIFSITQEASFISHFVILSPIMLYLFLCLNLTAGLGIFFSQRWGFMLFYFSIFVSIIFMVLTFIVIPRHEIFSPFYLSSLFLVNGLATAYLIYFQLKTRTNH